VQLARVKCALSRRNVRRFVDSAASQQRGRASPSLSREGRCPSATCASTPVGYVSRAIPLLDWLSRGSRSTTPVDRSILLTWLASVEDERMTTSDAGASDAPLGRELDEARGRIADLERRAEKAEAAHTESFHAIIEASPVPMALNDEQQRITFLNPAFTHAFGYTRADIPTLAHWWPRAYPEAEYRQQVAERWQVELDRSLRAGVPFAPLEVSLKCKDGSVKTVLASAAALANAPSGNHLVVLVDITDHRRVEEALQESEENYRNLYNDGPVMLHSFDPSGRLIRVSNRWLEVLGYRREEVLGRKPTEFMTDASRKFAEDVILPAFFATGIAKGARYQFVKRSGELVDIELSAVAELGPTGEFVSSRAVLTDVTDRNRAESAVRESERRLAAIFNASPIGISVSRVADGKLLDVNEAAMRLYGYSREEALGRTVTELGTYAKPEQREELVRRLVEHGSIERHPLEFRRRDGALGVMEVSGRILELSGEPCFVAMMVDITEQRRAAEALRLAAAYHRSLLEASLDPLVTIGPTGAITDVNAATERATGRSRDELIGTDFSDYFSDPDKARAGYERVFREGIARDYPLDLRHRDGHLSSVLYNASTYRDETGKVIGVFAAARDVTDRRRAEGEKAKLEDELRQALKMESVGRLAGGVAHDFNNMLGVILGHTELAMEHVDPGQPLHEDLEEIRKAARRSADLTRQLLAFARKQTVAPVVIDLNQSVASMLKMLQRLIGENVRAELLPGADLWPVRIDPSQLDQVLANLCVNARDAIAGVGTMTIETKNVGFAAGNSASPGEVAPGDYVRLVVRDDGCGMDEETLSHIFEPFFTTKGVGKGTGLGLATVYGIVKQNGGFIEVHSKQGVETTFAIHLPRHVDKAEGKPDAAAAPLVESGKETILVVEDEPAILKLAKRMLLKLGYVVLTASTPGEAIRVAQEHAGAIDLLVTDVIMPEMNGRELAMSLRASQPGLRSLFMSGYTADVIADQGVLEEGVHFLPKPFSQESLVARIRDALAAEPTQ
jgi:PAS domain S-box-containing protein